MSAEPDPGLELVDAPAPVSSGPLGESEQARDQATKRKEPLRRIEPVEPRAEAERGETAASRIAMVLAIVVAVLGLLLALQYQTARGLESQVARLEGELAAARTEIAVHERRMDAVRSHVEDVAVRLGALRSLVADPSRGPKAPLAE